MNLAATVVLALAMSTDAFAAAIGKGAALRRPDWREALRTGLIFGVIEASTPLIGWGVGRAAAPYVAAWDHWIAFVLLCALGLHMMRGSRAAVPAAAAIPAPAPIRTPAAPRHSFWLLALTGLATSIDALIVGVSLALVEADILLIALAIGISTFLLVTLGVMLGRVLGALAGRRAELAGGLVLIGIGCLILYEHIGPGA